MAADAEHSGSLSVHGKHPHGYHHQGEEHPHPPQPHPQQQHPLNPCKFWCRLCSLGHSCIAVGVAVIIIGLANLIGIYFAPPLEACFDSYAKQKHIEEWEPNNANKPMAYDKEYMKKTPEEQEAIATNCELILHLYTGLNSFFGLTSILAGVLILLAIFQRRAVFALVSAILLGVSVLLIICQAAIIFILSYARYLMDKERACHDYFIKHCQFSTSPAGQSLKCETAPFIGILGQQILAVLGGFIFALVYLYLGICAWSLQLYLKGNFELFARVPEKPTATPAPAPTHAAKPAQVAPENVGRSEADPRRPSASHIHPRPEPSTEEIEERKEEGQEELKKKRKSHGSKKSKPKKKK